MGFIDDLRQSVLKRNPGVIFPALAETQLLRWFGKVTDSASTVYDKALDAEYLKTHIGGGDHRLFDGGHDVLSAWERAKDALPDDTFSQEVIGCVSALWKDVTTVKGLPFATVDKAGFDNWVQNISSWGIPGLDRTYLYDLLSFDAMEIIASGFGMFGVIFALNKKDQEKLAEILASMGIVSITSANPIMGMITMGLTFYSYKVKKTEIDKKSFVKGGVITSSSVLVFTVLGLPFLIELIIVLMVSHLLKKHLFADPMLVGHFKSYFVQAKGSIKHKYGSYRKMFKKRVG
jgi:hypothetical protein